MLNRQLSGLALGTALIVGLAGCGGNSGVSNPTPLDGNFNPQAINQGNPNQNRLLSVVTADQQLSTIVVNATNLNQVSTTSGGTLAATDVNTTSGLNNFNLGVNGGVEAIGQLYAVGDGGQFVNQCAAPVQAHVPQGAPIGATHNTPQLAGGDVTVLPVSLDPSSGALSAPVAAVVEPFTGGTVSAIAPEGDGESFLITNSNVNVNSNTSSVLALGLDTPAVTAIPVDGNQVDNNEFDILEIATLPLDTAGFPGPLVAVSDSSFNANNFVGSNGQVSQEFGFDNAQIEKPTQSIVANDITVETPVLVGSSVSIDGANTDSVISDANNTTSGGITDELVVAAGPETADQATALGPGINVGSATLNQVSPFGFHNQASNFIALPSAAQVNSGAVVPTSITFVFGGNGQPAFAVIGTNNSAAGLVVASVNVATGQLNLLATTGGPQSFPMPINAGVVGLSTTLDLNNQGNLQQATRPTRSAAGVNSDNGFDSQNVVVAILGNGAGSALNAIGFDVNGLQPPSQLFTDIQGQIGSFSLGNENANQFGVPSVFTSFVP